MAENKSSRLVLTSVNQVILLVRNNPQLMEKMPRFKPLATVELSTTPTKSCNCASKRQIITPDENKQVAESILSALTSDEFLQIKNILGLRELCYYKRNTAQNKLELICV